MKLTVVGSADAMTSCGRGNSCYLLEGDGDGQLMADFGPTALAMLKRLRVDRIDLYQLHAADPVVAFEELVGQTMSLSVAPLEGHPKHAAMLQALEQFFVQFATDGRLTAPTTCWVTCGRFAVDSALLEPNASSLRNSI